MKWFRRIYLFLLLLLPNIYVTFATTDLTISPLKQLAYLVVVIVCLLLPAFVLKSKAYFIFEGIFSLFVAPIEMASVYLNRATVSTTFLELVFRTHLKEATELLSSLWPLLLIFILLWVLYFYFAAKEPQEWLFPKIVSTILLISIPVIVLIGTVVFSVYARRIHYEITISGTLKTAKDLALMKFYKIHPYDFYLNSIEIIKSQRQINRYNQQLETFSFNISPKTDTIAELYVLVIGETARAHNFSLNGYERQTNPRLQSRSNLLSFTHAYSQANLTQSAVPHILSRVGALQHDSIYAEKSLVEAFQEAGFAASWLNNGHDVRYVNRIIPVVDHYWSAGRSMSEGEHYDICMLQPFLNIVNTEDKQFIVLHHLGSHWRYDQRYPKQNEIYQPCAGSDFSINMIQPQNKQLLVNAYDNSILYTDFFLDTLITTIESLHIPTVMLYLSDHGENLYDDEQELVMHGTYQGTEYEYNIPFILWYSDEYKQMYPEKIRAAEENKNARFSTMVVFHSLLSAANIDSGIDYQKDIFNESLVEQDSIFALTGDAHITLLTPDNSLLH